MILAPILFATSNLAKFLQARLVLGWHSLDVQRLESHRVSYVEPYGLPREEFLSAGLDDVISRAGAKRLVFIEDTTALFPSLSTPGHEYPGQRTKEWFAETTHEELLDRLDATGGGRTVIVRSDILLHLPGHAPLLFSATTDGTVLERVRPVEVNNLYPWLGRPDLSSWFVPRGATKVLAAMQLEESVRYDFRAKSLDQLAARLTEYGAAVNLPPQSVRRPQPVRNDPPRQMPLPDPGGGDPVLIVIGRIASGKTTVGNYLELHRGFSHIESSRMLIEAASRLRVPWTGSNFELADLLFDRFGFDVVEREVVIPLLRDLDGPVVYTGCRTVEGIAAVKDAAREADRTAVVVFLSTPASLRLSRAADRAREDRGVDPARFDESSARDEAYGASRLGGVVCDVQITNTGNLASLLKRIDSVVERLDTEHSVVSPRRGRMAKQLAGCRSRVEAAALLRRLSPALVSNAEPSRISPRGAAFADLLDFDFATAFGAHDDDV